MKKNLKLSKFIIGASVATGFIGFAGLGLSVTAHAEEVETISIPATTESIQNNSHLVTNTETKPVEKESSVNNTSVTNLDSNKPTTENTTREKPVSEKPDNSNKPADTSNISKPSTTTETPKKDTDVNESPKLSGWVTKDGYKYYYENGKPITGLQKIDAARGSKTKYFALFDSKGRMHVNYWAKNSKGKRYFDKNGKMMTGWYNDGVERRYFHPKTGYMFTGLHRMDSSLYKTKTHYSMFDTNTGYIKKGFVKFPEGTRYFSLKDGWMVTGWINNNAGKTRFFHPESGIMMEGRQKMDSSLYNTTDHYSYFEKKTGCLKTGQVRDTNGYRFYDNNGWEYGQGWTCIDGQYWIMINSDGYQLTGNQMMVGMMYHFSDKGRLLSMETSTPHYYQYAHNFPTGCGPTSLLMALQYKGKARDFSLERFMSQIPYTNTGNPTLGFVGNPVNYYLTDSNRAIYPKALAEFGKRFGNVTDISGCPTGYLTDELRMGNPSVVLVTWGYVDYPITNYSWGKFRDANHHYNVLVGYNFTNDEYKVMDCGRNVGGGYRWIKGSTFRQIWEGIRGAVVVRD